jgi:hypothetical protein
MSASALVAKIKVGLRSQYRPRVEAGIRAMTEAIPEIIRRRTLGGMDAFGSPLAPLSDWRIRERGASGPILSDTGAMLGSIQTLATTRPTDDVVGIAGIGVTIVGDEPKATAHITGSWNHPTTGEDIGVERDFIGPEGGLSVGGQRGVEERELKMIFKNVTGHQRVNIRWSVK